MTASAAAVLRTPLLPALVALALAPNAPAEKGVVWLSVRDLKDRKVSDATFATEGPGTQNAPAVQGLVKLRVGPDTDPGDSVVIGLLAPTAWFLVSPWNRTIVVPRWEEKASNYVEVRIGPKKAVEILQDPRVAASLTARVDRSIAPTSTSETPATAAAATRVIADEIGVPPEAVDRALKDWAAKPAEPAAKAVGAIFLGDYAEAIRQLEAVQVGTGGALVLGENEKAFFHALASYQGGDYTAAAEYASKSMSPSDIDSLAFAATCLERAGNKTAADAVRNAAAALYRARRQLHKEARTNFDLAESKFQAGDYTGAQKLYQRALDDENSTSAPDASMVEQARNRLTEISLKMSKYQSMLPVFLFRLLRYTGIAALAILAALALLVAWRVISAAPPHPSQRMRTRVYQTGEVVLGQASPGEWYRKTALIAAAALFFLIAGLGEGPIRHAAQSHIYVSLSGRGDAGAWRCWSSAGETPTRTRDGWQFNFWLDPHRQPIPIAIYLVGSGFSGRANVTLAPGSDQELSPDSFTSQRYAFEGRVQDSRGNPTSGAAVRFLGTSQAATTDAAGRFVYPLDPALTSAGLLSVSAAGYRSAVVFRPADQNEVNVSLAPL